MALIPFAEHRLIPPGDNDPRINARIGILHVDAGNAYDLWDYFAHRSGGIESHGHIRKDGTIQQYRDTAFQADANLDANDFAISFESQGYAEGTWTDEQIATNTRVMLWARQEHNIPLRVVTSWDDFSGGWGYHTLFGAPSHWTPVSKSCPGPDRKQQFHDVLAPWMANPTQEDDVTPEDLAKIEKAIEAVAERTAQLTVDKLLATDLYPRLKGVELTVQQALKDKPPSYTGKDQG
jgi:hypothetical protein